MSPGSENHIRIFFSAFDLLGYMGLSNMIFCVLGGLTHFNADKIVMKTILSLIMKMRC